MERILCNEKDITQFLSTCKYLNGFKSKIVFKQFVWLDKIYILWYKDSFINIKLSNNIHKYDSHALRLPKAIQKLVMTDYSGEIYFIENTCLTHLSILRRCNLRTKNLIFPKTLQYLTWNHKRPKRFPTEGMPSSLKQLSISNYRHYPLVVPGSIKTLIINNNCFITDMKMPNTLDKIIISKKLERINHYEPNYGVNTYNFLEYIKSFNMKAKIVLI